MLLDPYTGAQRHSNHWPGIEPTHCSFSSPANAATVRANSSANEHGNALA